MLLCPNGSEKGLLEGGDGAIVDPFPSFDGEWIYDSRLHDQRIEVVPRDGVFWMAVWSGEGPFGWEDYLVLAQLSRFDDDGLGLQFRYQDDR